MGDIKLIDANSLIDGIQNDVKPIAARFDEKGALLILDSEKDIFDYIYDFPAVDAQPVKHGRWNYENLKDGFGKITCSCCGESINVSPYRYEDLKEYEKFCSNCGAKMDGGDEE